MLAIGLMSGTSRDGIDAALIETDGEGQAEAIIFHA
ncbi:anhydro-N-acetylmuramic acid kinase, partial [Sphingobium yanoikuyae]